MSLLLAGKGNAFGRRTQSAGTVISLVIPAVVGLIVRISRLIYNSGSTQHTLTLLRPVGRTKFSADAAAAATVVNIVEEPGVAGDGTINAKGYPQGVTANLLAASDLVAIREVDGVTRLYTVSSRTSLAITLSAGLVAGVKAPANTGGLNTPKVQCDMWMFGVLADVYPTTGLAHETILPVASATTTFTDGFSGLMASDRPDEPILVQSNNATAQGYIEGISFSYEPPIGV